MPVHHIRFPAAIAFSLWRPCLGAVLLLTREIDNAFLVNSNFTLSLVAGVQVMDLTLGTTLANMGYSDVKFPAPVFIGDTIYTETEVISKRESKSRPNAGLVEFETRGRNQRDEIVVILRRTGLMLKKTS